RTARIGRDERQVDVGLLRARELDLGLLGGLLEALESHAVAAEVDALLLLEFVREPVDDHLVEVITTEVRIAVGRQHLEDAFGEIEDRDVVRTTTEVVDGDLLVALLVEAVRERRRRRLVDDAADLETGDASELGRGSYR